MKGQLTVIYAEPPGPPGEPLKSYPLVGPPTLDQLQAAVGGYIEVVPLFDIIMLDGQLQPCVAFCNEEGKLRLALPRNFLADTLWQFALRHGGHPGLLQKHADGTVTQVVLVGDIAVVTGDDELLEAL